MSLSADGGSPARRATAPRDDALEAFREELFEDATQLAMRLSGAPLAALSLLQSEHRWFKSRGGISVADTPRAIALCSETAASGELLIVPDVAADKRFGDDPVVREGIRFFAGIPILEPDGRALGALAVMDREPRLLSSEQVGALRALGRQVEKELRLRRRADELEAAARSPPPDGARRAR